jgi:hypothetical protein
MPSSISAGVSANRATGAGPSLDHTRWMASVVEIIAIVGAVAIAYLHSAT